MIPQANSSNPSQNSTQECPEIYIKFETNPSVGISIPLESKLSNLKELVFELFDVSPSDQRMLHKGRQLRDDSLTLRAIGISPLDIVYLQEHRASEKETSLPSANSQFSSISSSSSSGNAMFADTSSDASTAAMGKLFRSPLVREMLSRPEVMENMLMADPRIRAMSEKNPEMKKMFTNPETMKEMLEMMTNPDYQKHVQKNVDRALINLNAMPGGLDALKQVYSMQKPLFEDKDLHHPQSTTTKQSIANYSVSSHPQDSFPNPWAASKATSKQTTTTPSSGQVFSQQLQELRELGFLDEQRNLNAINQANGNVQVAIEILIEEMEDYEEEEEEEEKQEQEEHE